MCRQRLLACLLNVSEGCNPFVLHSIAKAAVSVKGTNSSSSSNVAVINVFADKIYNRAVITIVGEKYYSNMQLDGK